MAFLTTGQIHVETHWTEMKKMTERAVNKALVQWAAVALEQVRAAETRIGDASPKRRVSPGVHLRDTFQVTLIPRLSGFGMSSFDVVVWTDNPNAIWQELGTRGRRRKKLKSGDSNFGASAEAMGGNRGVAPLYFMRTGMRRAFPVGLELIQNALGSIGTATGSRTVDTVPSHFFQR